MNRFLDLEVEVDEEDEEEEGEEEEYGRGASKSVAPYGFLTLRIRRVHCRTWRGGR